MHRKIAQGAGITAVLDRWSNVQQIQRAGLLGEECFFCAIQLATCAPFVLASTRPALKSACGNGVVSERSGSKLMTSQADRGGRAPNVRSRR
jgi:hypothetical protein